MTKILSIIPARGGSKGLRKKNIINLLGKPLIAWSIEASMSSEYISKTIVSSDDDEVLEIAKRYKSETIKRPNELATDDSSSEEVVKHVLEFVKESFEFLVLLQPTSPLRDKTDIDMAFRKLISINATSLISLKEFDNKVLKSFIEKDDGFIEGLVNNNYPFMRRQDLPKIYLSNGAIYIVKVDEFIKNNSFFTDKTIPFLMDDAKSVDIYSIEDLNEINLRMKQLSK